MSFTVALSTALMMLAYAIPGYLLSKTGKIKKESISAFAVMLVFACAPFQNIDCMQRMTYSPENTRHLGILFVIAAVTMGGMTGIAYLVLRKKQVEPRFRILTIATAFGNAGFMGIPLLEALLPQFPEAVSYASAYFMALNILVWTVASAIITHDLKYISLKKVFINPSTIAISTSLVLYFCRIRLDGPVYSFVSGLSKVCTPLCMFILGLRLGVVPLRSVFNDPLQYAAAGVKLLIFPLFTLCVCRLFPIERDFLRAIYIISCVPVGNLVLSFSEMLGQGQSYAANVVLLSTMLSVVTMPLMLLLV